MLALVISVFANGFAHEAFASCVPVSNGIGVSDSKAGDSAAFGTAVSGKEIRFVAAGHASKSGGDQSQQQCCDNWCPSLFLTLGQFAASVPELRDIRGLEPSDPLNSAFGNGLERPPRFSRII